MSESQVTPPTSQGSLGGLRTATGLDERGTEQSGSCQKAITVSLHPRPSERHRLSSA